MKVVFSLRNLWYVKHYEGVLKELAARGHDVVVITEPFEPVDPAWREASIRVAAATPAIRFVEVDGRADDEWVELARRLRWSLDYLRFLHPRYDNFPKLRERARDEAPQPVRRLTMVPGLRRGRLLSGVLDPIERAVPPPHALLTFLANQRPDVVILSPLVALGTTQLDVLRAAKQLRLRTIWAVGSWDHLSSKALVRDWPDRVFVWNARQREEAVVLHGLPPERVVVTGAQAFDDWFGWTPRPRAEFLRAAGLPPDKPYVLYACSCLMANSPIEAEFVREWAHAIRHAPSPDVRDVSILVRPHPKRDDEFDRVTIDLANLAIWPRGGVGPMLAESKADYFDSIYHAAVVIGLNTSAFIEAGIIGRPVHAVLLPQFWDNQEGTIHFHYLRNEAGGLLHVDRSLDDHVAALARTLRDHTDQRHIAFVEAFVRPHGMTTRASEVFVESTERIARQPAPAPVRRSLLSAVARAVLRPVARAALKRSDSAARAVRRERRDQRAAERLRVLTAKQEAAQRRATERRQVREAEKAERLRAHRAAKDAERAAKDADRARTL